MKSNVPVLRDRSYGHADRGAELCPKVCRRNAPICILHVTACALHRAHDALEYVIEYRQIQRRWNTEIRKTRVSISIILPRKKWITYIYSRRNLEICLFRDR